MGIFDKLFKNNKDTSMKIELTDNCIFINGNEILYPTSIEKISEIIGKPTQQFYDDNDWRIIWDNLGICANGLSNIQSLRILINPENNLKHLPQKLYKGKVLINGEPIENFEERNIKTRKYEVSKLRFKGDESNPIYSYMISKNYDYKEEIDKGKYKFEKISGAKIEFVDFNFKLAIIEELMYNKKLITPIFDVYEFAETKKIDGFSSSEGGYEPLPEVVEYFKALEIDKNFAEKVTEIYQDGGNEIYMNIAPQWDGEDDVFDIKSYDDIKHFQNIKKMILFSINENKIKELKAKGINAELL